MAESGPPDDQNTPRPLSFPVYGNYCGVGHGDPTFKTPPIDDVDLVCHTGPARALHDLHRPALERS
jgi:hypothetical protein